jgi:hypothetical protein
MSERKVRSTYIAERSCFCGRLLEFANDGEDLCKSLQCIRGLAMRVIECADTVEKNRLCVGVL